MIDDGARTRIRDDFAETLFVEAGAGTGKTSELVGRVGSLVLSGHAQVGELAIITFTEAAAGELRDRLRAAFIHAVRTETDPQAAERATTALDDLDAATICTLHSFARLILAADPLVVSLPPAFAVLDQIEADVRFDDHWNRFTATLFDDKELAPFIRLAFDLGLSLDRLRSAATKFDGSWDLLPPPAPLPSELPVIDTIPLREVLERITSLSGRTLDPNSKLLFKAAPLLDRVARLTFDDDAETLQFILQPGIPLVGNVGKKTDFPPGELDLLRLALVELGERCQTAVDAMARPVLDALRNALVQNALDLVEQRRLAGVVSFHDMLVLARNALRSSSTLRTTLQDRWRFLLIDEFQDTDPLQLEIALMLSSPVAEGDDVRPWNEFDPSPGRLFFVGDAKQAIYGFRRADMALFLDARARFQHGRLSLQTNFRSRVEVIDWINGVFAEFMPAEVERRQPEYQALSAGRTTDAAGRPTVAEDSPRVHLLGGSVGKMLAADVRAIEAASIADFVSTALHGAITIDAADGPRAPRCAEIAILVPRRRALDEIVSALDQRGIPVRLELGDELFVMPEIADLIVLLRAIDDAEDAVALVGALRSPLFGFTDDQLLRHRAMGGQWNYRIDVPPDSPLGQAFATLHDLHAQAAYRAPSATVQAVLDACPVFELAALSPRPRMVWQALRWFTDRVRAFTDLGGGSLRQFIEWAEHRQHDEAREQDSIIPEPDDDAVRVLTIHGAKGLEFPVCVVADLRSAERTERPSLVRDEHNMPQLTLGTHLVDVGVDPARAFRSSIEQHEDLRKLYVALTRARDHLVVSLIHSDRDRSTVAARLVDVADKVSHPARVARVVASEPLPPPVRTAIDLFPTPDPAQFDLVLAESNQRSSALSDLVLALSVQRVVTPTALAHAVDSSTPQTRPDIDLETTYGLAPVVDPGAIAGTAYGRAVHQTLELIDRVSGDELLLHAANIAADEGVSEIQAVLDAVQHASQSLVFTSTMPAQRHPELMMSGMVGAVLVEGIADLVINTPEGWWIVDFKTDIEASADPAFLVDRYATQLAAYAAILDGYGSLASVRASFLSCRPDAAFIIDVPDLRARIVALRTTL